MRVRVRVIVSMSELVCVCVCARAHVCTCACACQYITTIPTFMTFHNTSPSWEIEKNRELNIGKNEDPMCLVHEKLRGMSHSER